MVEQTASVCGQVTGNAEPIGRIMRRLTPVCKLTNEQLGALLAKYHITVTQSKDGALAIEQDDSRICVPYGYGGTKTSRDEDGSYSVAPERLDIAAIDWGHTGMPYRLSVEFRPNVENESEAVDEKTAATARILGSRAAAHIADTVFGAGTWSWTAREQH